MSENPPAVNVKSYPKGRLDKSLIVVISAKTLQKAVDRNLIKRRIREIMRTHVRAGECEYKVFVNSANVLDMSFSELKKEIENQL